MDVKEIKNWMKQKKITYPMLAEKTNMPLITIRTIMSGKTKHPRIDTMEAITKALGLDDIDFDKLPNTASISVSPQESILIDTVRSISAIIGDDYIITLNQQLVDMLTALLKAKEQK